MHDKALFVIRGRSSTHGHHPPSPPPPPPPPPPPSPPPGTVVGASGGLQISLLWDPSVSTAPSGFQQAIINAASLFTNRFTTKPVLVVIGVGFGEVHGTALSSGDLGESRTAGYLTNYARVATSLGITQAQNAPTGSQFFVPSGQAKLIGLNSPSNTATDGWIGLSASYPFDYSGLGNAYDPVGIGAHELSEVLGRLSLQGQVVGGASSYTPLDLFSFVGPGTLKLAANGYFSTDNGQTSLATFDGPSGDLGDWASGPVGNDAFNAFNGTGLLRVTDVDYMAAGIGYR